MTSVHISPEIDSRKRRLSRTLFLTAFGVVAFVLIDWVILRRQIDPIDLAAFGVFFAVWAFWSDKPTPSFDLEMDSDEIRMVEDGSVKRTVSKDRICYVREWSGNIFRKPVIVISERNAVGTRLLGGIAVPKNIPECEQIKTQALSWLENSKT